MKLSVQERVRVGEKLLESADAEDDEAAILAAWADERLAHPRGRARRWGDYWTQSADANLLAEIVIVQLPF
jgi:hypothetical protein